MNQTTNNSTIHLTVVVPTFNESEIIQDSLQQIIEFLNTKEYTSEIIISDDGSSDNTTELVKDIQSKRDHATSIKEIKLLELMHYGKGHAVKEGLLNAKGDYIIFMDADLSTPVEEVDQIMGHLNNRKIVIGSRRLIGLPSEHRQPFYRHIAGDFFAFIVRLIFLPGIRDPQCGFKGFHQETAIKLATLGRLNGFVFDTELLYIAKKLKIPVKEVNVIWRDSGNSSINLFRHGFQMFIGLIKISIMQHTNINT